MAHGKHIAAALALSILTGSVAGGIFAAEFRSRLPIRAPAPPPAGAVRVERVQPVARSVVEDGIRKLFAAYGYNPADTAAMLDGSFADRSRLLDTMAERLPRDAKLRVLGIQSVRTLDQFLRTDPSNGATVRVSTVTATVRSQLEYNDRATGFNRLDGTVEYLLRVEQPHGQTTAR